MSKKGLRKIDGLIGLMSYALAHRPDEFGLAPDLQGFVNIKELIQAFHEEPEWKYVRESHINEAMIYSKHGLFELKGNRIRALARHWEHVFASPSLSPPKIMFSPIRRRAHYHAFKKGLRSTEGRWIILCPSREMALRIGKRKDSSPVILEIRALEAYREGIPFFRLGSLLLANEIVPKYIGGPLPPKQEPHKASEVPKQRPKDRMDFGAGTFVLDITRDPDPHRRAKGRKPKGWKEEVRKIRRKKRR